MSSLSFTKSTLTRGKDEVFVAAMALRATKGAAQFLMSAAYSLSVWDLLHSMVIIKPSSPLNSQIRGTYTQYLLLCLVEQFLVSNKVYEFSNTWEVDLRVGLHDCRDYTNGLVEQLTGEKLVLEQLRRTSGGQSQVIFSIPYLIISIVIHGLDSRRTIC